MSDVRKEGPHFRTVRAIYRENATAGARVLLFPEGKLLKAAQVELYKLEVESDDKKQPKKK